MSGTNLGWFRYQVRRQAFRSGSHAPSFRAACSRMQLTDAVLQNVTLVLMSWCQRDPDSGVLGLDAVPVSGGIKGTKPPIMLRIRSARGTDAGYAAIRSRRRGGLRAHAGSSRPP
eukprot:2225043-Rhodomonas_salina.5